MKKHIRKRLSYTCLLVVIIGTVLLTYLQTGKVSLSLGVVVAALAGINLGWKLEEG